MATSALLWPLLISLQSPGRRSLRSGGDPKTIALPYKGAGGREGWFDSEIGTHAGGVDADVDADVGDIGGFAVEENEAHAGLEGDVETEFGGGLVLVWATLGRALLATLRRLGRTWSRAKRQCAGQPVGIVNDAWNTSSNLPTW